MRALLDRLTHEREPRVLESLAFALAHLDDDVRDWATFGLGTLLRLDTPAIRDALLARLDDAHHNTREEAMYGLAVRLDPRAIPVLLDFLEEFEGPMLDSALLILADHVDDPRLSEAVTERWPDGVPADARDQADSDWFLANST